MNKVTSLEELKEMASRHLEIELEIMKELPKQNFKDTMYFMHAFKNAQIFEVIEKPIRFKELGQRITQLLSI